MYIYFSSHFAKNAILIIFLCSFLGEIFKIYFLLLLFQCYTFFTFV